jgi:hypothetical protein
VRGPLLPLLPVHLLIHADNRVCQSWLCCIRIMLCCAMSRMFPPKSVAGPQVVVLRWAFVMSTRYTRCVGCPLSWYDIATGHDIVLVYPLTPKSAPPPPPKKNPNKKTPNTSP